MRYRGDFYRERMVGTAGISTSTVSDPDPTPGDPEPTPGTVPTTVEDVVATDEPTSGGGSTEPTQGLPELQQDAVNDIATEDGNGDEVPTYTLEEIEDIVDTVAPPRVPYYIPHPYLPGNLILVTENGGTVIPEEEATGAEIITGGLSGGGFGGGLPLEEEEFVEDSTKVKKSDNTKTIVTIVLVAVALYLAYKYLYKKN